MQKVSTKKITHKEAKRHREVVQDAVMYQHRNGGIYVVSNPENSALYSAIDPNTPLHVSDDPNVLLIGGLIGPTYRDY